jgi:hypothetical protein
MDIRNFFGAKPDPPKKAITTSPETTSSKLTISKSGVGEKEKPPEKSSVFSGDKASKTPPTKTICQDKILTPVIKEVEKPPDYHFHIHVREGAPGFADDESYESPPYATFEECYEKCIFFRPEAHWRHYRYTQSVSMSRNKAQYVSVSSTAQGCGLIDVNHLVHLGVTEAQFDHVIWSLEEGIKDKIQKINTTG